MRVKNILMLRLRNSIFPKLFLLGFFLNNHYTSSAQQLIKLSDNAFPLEIGKSVEILADQNGTYDSLDIVSQTAFKTSNKSVPNFTKPAKSIWIRFRVINLTHEPTLYLSIKYANISNVLFYEKDSSGRLLLIRHTGNSENFDTRGNGNVDFNFLLDLHYNSEKTFYINVATTHPLALPISINSYSSLNENNFIQNFIIGIYCGIILSTFLYNLFVSFATKDRSYFIYFV